MVVVCSPHRWCCSLSVCVCDLLIFLHRWCGLACSSTTQGARPTPSTETECLWEVFVWWFGVLFLSCGCVSMSGVVFSVGVCVYDLLIFLHRQTSSYGYGLLIDRLRWMYRYRPPPHPPQVVRPHVLFDYAGRAPDAFSAFLTELQHLADTRLGALDPHPALGTV